jgi:hypothetical protein
MTGNHLAVGTAGRVAFAPDVVIGSDGRSIAIGAMGATGAADSGMFRFAKSPGDLVNYIAHDGSTKNAFAVSGNQSSFTDVYVGNADPTSGNETLYVGTKVSTRFFVGNTDIAQVTSSGLSLTNKNISMPSGGYIHMGGGASGAGAANTYICDPQNIATVLAALPSSGGTLLLRPGRYGTVTISQSANSLIALAALAGGGGRFGGPVPQLAISWVPAAGSGLTLSDLFLINDGVNNCLTQEVAGAAAATLNVNRCSAVGAIDARRGGMVTIDNCETDGVYGSSVRIRNDSRIRGAIMGGSTTRFEQSIFESPAGTVHTSVGTLAIDAYSVDSFATSRSRLAGSGPLRALAGMQIGGILGDANAQIMGPTGPLWLVPGTNTGNRDYTFHPTGFQDQSTLFVECRDTSSNFKNIVTQTGTPSGTIATLINGQGHIFKYTVGAGLAFQSRYALI